MKAKYNSVIGFTIFLSLIATVGATSTNQTVPAFPKNSTVYSCNAIPFGYLPYANLTKIRCTMASSGIIKMKVGALGTSVTVKAEQFLAGKVYNVYNSRKVFQPNCTTLNQYRVNVSAGNYVVRLTTGPVMPTPCGFHAAEFWTK